MAAALLAPLLAGTALAIVIGTQSPLDSAARAEPLVGAVEQAERADDVQVSIAVEFVPATEVVVATGGVVTAVGFAPGDEVVTGTRLVSVDDRDVVAYASDAPLFRDLGRGATGRDVSTAQTLLAQLGLDPGPVNGIVGSATVRAIVAFNKAHGYGSNNTSLALASLAWVGTTAITVAEVHTTLGTTVGPGTALFEGVAAAAAITVTEPVGLPRGAALELVVGATSTEYELGSGRVVDPEAVAAIAEIIGTASDRVGTIRLADPLVVGTIPSSAVVTDRDGDSCIFPDTAGDSIGIEPLGGSLGTVDVNAKLIGQPVLLNPRDVRRDLSCG